MQSARSLLASWFQLPTDRRAKLRQFQQSLAFVYIELWLLHWTEDELKIEIICLLPAPALSRLVWRLQIEVSLSLTDMCLLHRVVSKLRERKPVSIDNWKVILLWCNFYCLYLEREIFFKFHYLKYFILYLSIRINIYYLPSKTWNVFLTWADSIYVYYSDRLFVIFLVSFCNFYILKIFVNWSRAHILPIY